MTDNKFKDFTDNELHVLKRALIDSGFKTYMEDN